MIVYGDAIECVTLAAAASQLRARMRRALRSARPSLDRLRTLLILAGEIEQAVLDARPSLDPALAARVHALTGCIALAFAQAWFDENAPGPQSAAARDSLCRGLAALEVIARAGDVALEIRVPEGFAHYALYPEQYIEAALLWAADHVDVTERNTLVVGIRSIGTVLAALVAAVLGLRGFAARAISLRPSGHPFARRAQLAASELGGARWALVVDEGPGLSGSSMASVADALVRAGMPRAAISLMPGHAGVPGPAASPEIAAFWSSTPRYSVPLSRVRLCGRRVPETLAATLPELYGPAASVESIEDLSRGAWRSVVYAQREQWPAVCTAFERTKLRCTTRGGARYLFKFAGLGSPLHGEPAACEAQAGVLKQRADLGYSPRPIAVLHGFVATRWVDGRPLCASALDTTVAARLGRYLAQSAGSRLSEAEQAAAVERLENVVSANVGEMLGDAAAGRVRELFLRGARDERDRPPRAYGDGHLAPHEWLRAPHGDLIKVDCTGHADDHTVVGKQSIAWDIAGAAIEWKLPPGALERMLASYRAAGGEAISAAQLTAYRLAYAAFRAGQFKLCGEMCGDDALERAALARAYGDCCAELCRVL